MVRMIGNVSNNFVTVDGRSLVLVHDGAVGKCHVNHRNEGGEAKPAHPRHVHRGRFGPELLSEAQRPGSAPGGEGWYPVKLPQRLLHALTLEEAR